MFYKTSLKILIKVSVSCFIGSYTSSNGTKTTAATCVSTVLVTSIGTAFTRFTTIYRAIAITVCFTRFSALTVTSRFTVANTTATTIAPTGVGTKGAYGART